GLTVAYSLARENVRVEVVDRGDFGQEASWAGAGIIPPGNPTSARTPFDRLRALSSEAFPTFSRELRERTGIDNGYLRCAGLVIPEDHEDADDQEWRGDGIRCEELTASEVRRLEPNLAAGSFRALHLPDTAQLRNPRHVKALVAGCASLGVRLRSGCPAAGLECDGDRVSGVSTPHGPLTAGHYVIASGAWREGLLAQPR